MKFLIVSVFFSLSSFAADLKVEIKSKNIDKGTFFCSLHNSEKTFPRKATESLSFKKIKGLPKAQKEKPLFCEFSSIDAGNYAVLISHDINDNGKLDRNFIGIPNEPWGVSNNVRPSFRGPKYPEAKFEIKEDLQIQVEVK